VNQHFGLFLKEKLLSLNLGAEYKFEGCTAEEIEAIKAAQGVKCLPQKYVEFLEVMGKGAGGQFLIGEDYTYPYLLSLKQDAQDIINDFAEDYPEFALELSSDAFVFYGHHGVYFFFFFTADCDDDPPVHMWSEVRGKKQVNNHLSELFVNAVHELADFATRSRSRSPLTRVVQSTSKSWLGRLFDEVIKILRSL